MLSTFVRVIVNMRGLILLLVLGAFVTGCGYKAPLFLPAPDAKAAATRPAVKPEPAPERPVPADATPQLK